MTQNSANKSKRMLLDLLKTGCFRPSMIAREARIHPMTVSRIIGGNARHVRPSVYDRIKQMWLTNVPEDERRTDFRTGKQPEVDDCEQLSKRSKSTAQNTDPPLTVAQAQEMLWKLQDSGMDIKQIAEVTNLDVVIMQGFNDLGAKGTFIRLFSTPSVTVAIMITVS